MPRRYLPIPGITYWPHHLFLLHYLVTASRKMYGNNAFAFYLLQFILIAIFNKSGDIFQYPLRYQRKLGLAPK